MIAPIFLLGRVVATPGALTALVVTGQPPANSRIRHQPGDRDDIPPTAAVENRVACATDGAS